MTTPGFQHPANRSAQFNPNGLPVTRTPRIIPASCGPVFDGGLATRGLPPQQDPWLGYRKDSNFTWDQKNIELMLNGQPPWGRDGHKMQLHHRANQVNGPLDEYPWTIHKLQHGLLHDADSALLDGAIGHYPTRRDYDAAVWSKQRGRYWVSRALAHLFGTALV
jgi:hypothetical protein